MTAEVIGEQPKPRALIFGFDNTIAERIGALFSSRQVINDFEEVEQREWDVVVTTRSVLHAEPHLYVIGLGCDTYESHLRGQVGPTFGYFHSASQPQNLSHGVVVWTPSSKARELAVPKELPQSIKRLVKDRLVPLMHPEQIHQFLQPNATHPATATEWTTTVEPFVATRYGQCLAGRFPRPGAISECWCFPGYAVSLTHEIVEVALREWHKRDPETFPLVDWENQATWRTPDENRVAEGLEDLEAKRTAILAELDERQRHLEAEAADAKRSAKAHERLLLTSQGDDLVGIVAQYLSEMGFEVMNMDQVPGASERLEDLRVATKGHDWTALAEIKGYSGGAKANDLLKFGRYWLRYFQQESTEPNAGWYIVNQFLADNPSTRRPILSGNEASLSTFATDYNGLAIDTADLFRLWMAVKDRRLTVKEARSRLMQARGRFAFED